MTFGPIVTLDFDKPTLRRCGDCQLCCKLMPIQEIDKAAGARCPHQKVGVGCKIYARRPTPCRLWSCRWLMQADTADLRRPDRSHYVLDPIPDYVTAVNHVAGTEVVIPCIQIWVDPSYPDAHRDPALRRYLERQSAEGWVGLVRLGASDGLLLVPPAMADDNQWHEQTSESANREHRLHETIASIATGVDIARHPD